MIYFIHGQHGLINRVMGWQVNSVDSSFFFVFFSLTIFFNFIIKYWIDYFYLLSMRLSRFYDLDHMFSKLTFIDSGLFIVSCFQINFFLISTFNNEFIEKLDFINFFDLLSIRLSQSHELDRKFDRLTSVDSCHFLFIFYEVILIS